MNREPMSNVRPDMLPPAKTREVALGPAPARGLSLLEPVVSRVVRHGGAGPRAHVEPVEQAREPIGQRLMVTGIEAGTFTVDDETGDLEIVAKEVTIELEAIPDLESDDDIDEALTLDVESPDLDLDEAEEATMETAFGSIAGEMDEEDLTSPLQWYGDDRSAPWERTDRIDESGEIRAAAGDEATGIWLAEDDAEEELVLDPSDAAERSAPPDAALRQAPPPLSPWDLGAESMAGEAGERVARARAEWESLGQALSESLIAAGPPPEEPGPHGYELTDEKAAELDADVSPFGGPVMSVGGAGTAESPVGELVRRLEAFAASLRDQGPGVLARAQTGDDRFDALLASIAAGFLAGRGE